jgi:hypothetical protein
MTHLSGNEVEPDSLSGNELEHDSPLGQGNQTRLTSMAMSSNMTHLSGNELEHDIAGSEELPTRDLTWFPLACIAKIRKYIKKEQSKSIML